MEDKSLPSSPSPSERQSFAPSAWLGVLADLAEDADDEEPIDRVLASVTRSIASHVGDGALILRVIGGQLTVVAVSHRVDSDRLRAAVEGLPPRVKDAWVAAVLESTDPLRLADLDALAPPSLNGHPPPAFQQYLATNRISDVLALDMTAASANEASATIMALVRDQGSVALDSDDARSLQIVGHQLRSLLDHRHDRARLRVTERERDVARAVLDTVLETAPIGFAFHDPEFRFLGINTRLAEVNGVPVDEHLGRTIQEVVPELAPGLMPRLRHVLTTGEALIDLEVTDAPAGDAPARYWRTSHYPVRLPDGEMIGVGAVVSDITDQRQVDEELRSRLLQQEAVAALGQRALQGGGDDDSLFDAACRIASKTLQVPYVAIHETLPDGETSLLRNGIGWPDDIVGNARIAISPDTQVGAAMLADAPLIVEDLPAEEQYHGATRLLAYGIISSINVLIAGRDRPWGVLSAHSTRQRRFTQDDIYFLQAIANVLSASIERKLVEHERQLLLDSANEGIFGINIDGICTYINQAALDLLGYTVDECLGRNMHELTHYKRPDGSPYPEQECPIYQAMWTSTSERLIDETLWRKDGTPLPALYSCSPVVEHGRVSGSVVTIVDLRERQRIEQALRESLEHAEHLAQAEQEARQAAEAAVAVREEFLSIASHELKTPLTTIKATAQLLDRRLRLPEIELDRVLRHAALLQREIGRLETLVDDLLNATHIQRGRLELRPEEIDLVEIARLAINRFEHAPERHAGHQIVLDSPVRVVGWFDPGRIDQVLTNLISNALKYSPNGGEVRVMIRERSTSDARSETETPSIEITVRDHGIGISPQEQRQLFQPFARGADIRQSIRGSGLGLYIVARIVTQHGGSIRVESTLGEGSAFVVRLPAGVTGDG